jgi:GNAT superfamily N-acetyltransferase
LSEIPKSSLDALTIRPATDADTAVVLSFIQALAEYEKLSHEVVADEATLRRSLFGDRPVAEILIAELGDDPAGFALYFHSFSTFLGRPGIYLEDLFVKPELRGRGVGRGLLSRLARIAVERHCGRLEWSVLDWNRSAIEFYENLGALPMDGWTVYRISGHALRELATTEPD